MTELSPTAQAARATAQGAGPRGCGRRCGRKSHRLRLTSAAAATAIKETAQPCLIDIKPPPSAARAAVSGSKEMEMAGRVDRVGRLFGAVSPCAKHRSCFHCRPARAINTLPFLVRIFCQSPMPLLAVPPLTTVHTANTDCPQARWP